MELQYISDTNGNHTAVVISIEEWNNLTMIHSDLKSLENPIPKKIIGKLSEKYAGKLPASIAEDFQNYLNQSRGEWNN